eukprot:scaffold3156_cov268-Chaetoceros_neogracile.AAC.17
MTSSAKVLVKFLPFEVKLQIDSSQNRNLRQKYSPINWFSSSNSAISQHRQAFTLNISEFTSIVKDYFDEYLRSEFDNASGKTIYAPFSHVSLSSLSDRRRRLDESIDRVQMDGIVNFQSVIDPMLDIGMDSQEMDMEFEMIPIRSGNLRRRKLDIVFISRRYDGVSVFTRDGDLPVPSTNFLQAKQLQAQSDENSKLLNELQASGDLTGLYGITDVQLGVSTSEPDTSNDDGLQPPVQADSFDAVIIIAVVVAACSMLLLGFAIYLAFRRRQDYGVQLKTNEISPTTKGTDQDPSPKGRSTRRGHAPPVFEIKQSGLQHDDAISEYTESVYSLPSAVKTAKKAWLQHSSRDPSISKPAKTSARFNPKYILSSRSNTSSSADEGDLLFDNFGATEEMQGVPQMTSPMKKALRETEKQFALSRSTDVPAPKIDKVADNTDVTKEDKTYADIIDDDITSSLSAYGAGISNHFKSMVDKADDGESVISYESYGFSLDGADCTVANSTKYGY